METGDRRAEEGLDFVQGESAIAQGLKFVMDLFGLSVKDLVSAFTAIEKAWVHTTSFLADAWTTFTAGFMKVWNKAKGFVAKGIARLKKLFGAKVDVAAVSREIDAETERANRDIDSRRKEALSERERQRRERLAEIDAGRGDTERALQEFFSDAKRREKFDAQRRAVDLDVDEAKRALNEAIQEAAEGREGAKAPGKPGQPRDPKAAREQLLAAGKRFQSTAGGRSSVVGSFSAFAVNRFGAKGSSIEQQQLGQLQQINQNTKHLRGLEPPKL